MNDEYTGPIQRLNALMNILLPTERSRITPSVCTTVVLRKMADHVQNVPGNLQLDVEHTTVV